MRRLSSLAVFVLALAAGPALAANPQVELDTTAGTIKLELYPGRSAEDRRELPRVREGRPLQRHAVPSRDQGLHDPGRRLRRRVPARSRRDRRSRSSQSRASKAGLSNVPGTVAMARTGDPNSATVAVLHQRRRQQAARLHARPIRKATATRCSARSSPAWTSSTRSRKGATGAGGRFPTDVPVERVVIKSARSSSTPVTRLRRIAWSSCTPTTATSRSSSTARTRPRRVTNFLQYVRDGHYDNTLFHRVIPGFMIQGGGFAPGMKQKPTRDAVANEAGQRRQEQALHGGDGAHVGSAFGDRAVLHQRRRQRLPRLQGAERRRAGAIACSARSSAGKDVVDRIAGVATGRSRHARERADRRRRHHARRGSRVARLLVGTRVVHRRRPRDAAATDVR